MKQLCENLGIGFVILSMSTNVQKNLHKPMKTLMQKVEQLIDATNPTNEFNGFGW